MRIKRQRLRSLLVWLVMAALCGLIGFFIVYYYTLHERPLEQFAIVVDAGSTQTRSSLYQITIHAPDWGRLSDEQSADHQDADADGALDGAALEFPLGDLMQVRQVSSCVNGGPLAAISGPQQANELVRACLVKFTNRIKSLDFVDGSAAAAAVGEGPDELPDADEVSRQLALTDHRVNSVTYMHLAATAGMRALEQLNGTKARERLRWMDEAIATSNELILHQDSPFVNKGFVGIISGSDEASFGWISVNFICDTLAGRAPTSARARPLGANGMETVYRSDGLPLSAPIAGHSGQRPRRPPHSIGTLELGGASAQMAFQAATDGRLGGEQIRNMSLDEQHLDLFNGQYRMATRSDLCLGMSQAVLRLNYLALHRLFADPLRGPPISDSVQLSNPCLQRGARLAFTGQELARLWQGACLVSNSAETTWIDAAFRAFMTSRRSVEMLGTGEADRCGALLTDLIEPARCRRHFSLCPVNRNLGAPPAHMPFVTISGYNHALNVLGLERIVSTVGHNPSEPKWQELSQTIDSKLGGGSIDYLQFMEKTGEFCSTHSRELLTKYPKVNEKFRDIICLQLVYIRKLLTEFYRFEPATSWSQIKFLVFPPKSVPSQFSALTKTNSSSSSSSSSDVRHVQLEARRDIGWALGLLLNATSHQFMTDAGAVYFHHGASVLYIVRATVLLMLACCLIAIGLLVAGVLEAPQVEDDAGAYINHSSTSSSSYDVSHLAPTPRQGASHMKDIGLKYVLSQ